MADHQLLDGLQNLEKLAKNLAKCRADEESKLAKPPEVNSSKLETLAVPSIDLSRAYLKRETQLTEAQAARRDCEAKAVIDAQKELIGKAYDRAGTDLAATKVVRDYINTDTGNGNKIKQLSNTMYGTGNDPKK